MHRMRLVTISRIFVNEEAFYMVKGGILSRIQSMVNDLPVSEQKVAGFVLSSPRDAVAMSVHEVADRSGTSSAAVIRFCRSIGLNGFPELKMQLSVSNAYSQNRHSGYLDIESNEPVKSVIRKTINNSLQTLQDTEAHLDVEVIENTVKALQRASVIYVYGVGASAIVAEDAAQKWLRLGKVAYFISDRHLLAAALANAPKSAVFFGISYSGETTDLLELMKLAKELELTTMGLSKFGSNKLTSLCDFMLFTSRAPEAELRSAATSSRLAQLLVIDILFLAYASSQYEATVEQLSASRDAVKHLQ